MPENLKSVDSFAIGDRAEAVNLVTDAHLALYAGLTGGADRLGADGEAARAAGLAGRAVPGMLLAGYAAAALTALVAPGAVTIGHDFAFPTLARPGDTIRSVCHVESIDRERRVVTVRMRCTTQRGHLVLDGIALEKFPRPQAEGGPPGGPPAGMGAP